MTAFAIDIRSKVLDSQLFRVKIGGRAVAVDALGNFLGRLLEAEKLGGEGWWIGLLARRLCQALSSSKPGGSMFHTNRFVCFIRNERRECDRVVS